jgi:enamine deaminase RidA (YjgF/YER057c/UK114 family)
MATDPATGGVAVKALPVGWMWPDWPSPMKAQTAYVLEQLGHILEAAGSSLQEVLKAQVYILDPDEITFVDEVWREVFPVDPPARTITIVNDMALRGGLIEINLVAAASNGRLRKEVIRTSDVAAPLFHESQAVRAGNLVFFSTQVATADVTAQSADPDFPFQAAAGRVQTEVLLRNVDALCRAAGGTLQDVVRVQTHFTDLAHFDAAHEVWQRTFTEIPPAWTITQVKGPLPVRGAVLLSDVMAYIDAV